MPHTDGMPVQSPADRIDRLAANLRDHNLRAVFAWDAVTMAYLHGFRENAHERFMTLAVRENGDIRLIAPGLSANQASRAGITDVRAWIDGEDPLVHLRQLAEDWQLGGGTVALDNEMPAHMVLAIQETLPATKFIAANQVVASLMRTKSATEIDALRRAGAIADRAFETVLPTIRAGQTERSIAARLRDAMAADGGIPTFCIIATGAYGAEPHHETGTDPIQRGDVVILDFGCEVDGYQSDITRTIAVGEPDPEADRVYEAVYRGHMAARQRVAIGVNPEDVDRAARAEIESAGYGEFFVHRTGHGIGMRGHEEPNIVAGNRSPLAIGDCFSIEPGVYLPGRFGVRIENIITVSESGEDSLNADPAPHLIRVDV